MAKKANRKPTKQKRQISSKEAAERDELEAYAKEKEKQKKSTLKTIGLVLLCVILAIAFCLPSLSLLLPRS